MSLSVIPTLHPHLTQLTLAIGPVFELDLFPVTTILISSSANWSHTGSCSFIFSHKLDDLGL